MRSDQQSPSEQTSFVGLNTGIFFLLFHLYVWLIIDPRLVDHAVGILSPYYSLSFTAGWPFLHEHLSRSGGIVEYVARFTGRKLASLRVHRRSGTNVPIGSATNLVSKRQATGIVCRVRTFSGLEAGCC